MIHPDTIQQVKEAADIYDVVSEHVVLSKRGKDYFGLCPFHEEKTPSFSVSRDKSIYYCFGCQATGNSIKFLMDFHRKPFPEVVSDLAVKYQVPYTIISSDRKPLTSEQISYRKSLYEILASASLFYFNNLQRPQSQHAIDYLTNARGFSQDTIHLWKLGYAPNSWDSLYQHLVQTYPASLIEKAGLIKPKDNGHGYYDVFRDRIIIPVCDPDGRVVAFGGRTLGNDQPKYLNSPDTELFHKRQTLFALDKAKDSITQSNQVILVEGYFDAIALHAANIPNVVASLGTSITEKQIKLALRYSSKTELIFNLDNDSAGMTAVEKAIGEVAELAYKGEIQLKVLTLPTKDADDYLRNYSSASYTQLVSSAPLWLDWQLQQISKECNLTDLSHVQQVTTAFVSVLRCIFDINVRDYYVQRCAEILSGNNPALIPFKIKSLLQQLTPKPIIKTTPSTDPKPLLSPLESAESILLKIYIHYPSERENIVTTLAQCSLECGGLEFTQPHYQSLWTIILDLDNDLNLSSSISDFYLANNLDIAPISHLLSLDYKSELETKNTSQALASAISYMERSLRQQRYRYFFDLWKHTDSNSDPDLWQLYYTSFHNEKVFIQQLDKQRLFSSFQ